MQFVHLGTLGWCLWRFFDLSLFTRGRAWRLGSLRPHNGVRRRGVAAGQPLSMRPGRGKIVPRNVTLLLGDNLCHVKNQPFSTL